MGENWGNRREIPTGGGGGNFTGLDFGDREVKFFKLKEGMNRIEILPYTITTNMHPLVVQGRYQKGNSDYNIVLYVHRSIGPGKRSIICPSQYGKPCPICEAAKAAKDEGDKATNDALYARRRVFYNVVDNADRDAGVQLFETNIKYFQKPLETADKYCATDFPGKFFPSIKDGLTISVLGAKDSFNGNEFIQASSITFVNRTLPVAQFEKDVIPLDQCIKLKSYEEIENIMMGVDTGDDEEEAPQVERPAVEETKTEEAPSVEETKEDAPPTESDTDCPHGFPFGDAVHADHKECDDCPERMYMACVKAARKR